MQDNALYTTYKNVIEIRLTGLGEENTHQPSITPWLYALPTKNTQKFQLHLSIQKFSGASTEEMLRLCCSNEQTHFYEMWWNTWKSLSLNWSTPTPIFQTCFCIYFVDLDANLVLIYLYRCRYKSIFPPRNHSSSVIMQQKANLT